MDGRKVSYPMQCNILNLYRDELLQNIVPFWQRHSIDKECGGFFTCLDRAGDAYSTNKYMWLQGRAVWMFARLHNEVDSNCGWLDIARQGADFLERHGRSPDGRVYFSLTREGRPIHLQRKFYSEVFYVMAMTEMARATRKESYLACAKELFWRIVDMWRDSSKTGRPILDGTFHGSNLANPMVLLGMIEELSPLDDDPRYDELASEAIRLARRHFRPDRRIVLENVGPNGEFVDEPIGRLLNPGHAIEMGWFLIRRGRTSGDKSLIQLGLDAIRWSMEIGWDSEYGGLFYFLDCDNRPPLPLEWHMKLWWPISEAIYALLLGWDETGDMWFLDQHRKVHEYAWDHLRDAQYGEWFGYLDRQGRPTHMLKGGEWKGFFHVPRALLYSIQLLKTSPRNHH
jgi:N-acylglucosamine 2-epimerase